MSGSLTRGLAQQKKRGLHAEARTKKSPVHFLAFGMGLLPGAGLSENRGTATQPKPVATIDGSIVSEADLAQTVAGQLQQLRQREYELKSKALDQLIARRLLEVEAAKQGISVDQLTDREVKAKVGEPRMEKSAHSA